MAQEIEQAKTLANSPAPTRLGPRVWTAIILLSLVGQLAWTVENMYLNVFVYDTITTDPNVIALLVACSATTATIATMLIGVLSDKVGRRKAFIVGGYLPWGITTAAFGFIQVDSQAAVVADAVLVAVIGILVLDCVMSFLGSGANDAAFQAWVTDKTDPTNRGRVDGVIVVMPLVAMLIVFGGFDPLTQNGQWKEFFVIFGVLVMIVGLASLWLVDDSAHPVKNSQSYFASLIHGLRPSVMRRQPRLYSVLLTWVLWAISVQVFLPYLIIYIREYLKIDNYALVLAVVLTLASVASIFAGRLMDRVGKVAFLIPAGAIYGSGLLAMFFVKEMTGVMIAGTVMMSGFMFVNAALAALVRDESPDSSAGQVQGIRMICAIMIPSIIGPFVGAAVIRNSGNSYIELGVEKSMPTPLIFLAAVAIAALSFLPALLVRKLYAKNATPQES